MEDREIRYGSMTSNGSSADRVFADHKGGFVRALGSTLLADLMPFAARIDFCPEAARQSQEDEPCTQTRRCLPQLIRGLTKRYPALEAKALRVRCKGPARRSNRELS
jgi:hypothetical protein